ncbi:4-(cytidine 5'-diphospho)-2-C-methyl-D-erythritol kinase [Parenemella sanctibonifatiensis]|uniref:4-diphosphocytidyl-2-C-methyl-D-erythritol kinase n=2 Tax=Parenemella sanctibonifatiensis TaxID=2016505 RepID=A0A255EFZ9_9ACTN|nr:4-(cytidine 5'-diphospho)-2-C-methyl-D-erythritol kinase [Parenemella sanctibonifatiensis]
MSMEPTMVKVRVPAKVNLGLAVGPVVSGYHQIATVFQAVGLYDELVAELAEPGVCELLGDLPDGVTAGEDNLAIRAARLLMVRFEPTSGVRLRLRKRIPVAGGMAGGSADAAAALLACSVLWDLDTDPDDLLMYGAQLGSDVPFALMGGAALGTDRGNRLAPALSRGHYHWVLVFGAEGGLSTPEVYRRFDELNPTPASPSVPTDLLEALTSGDPHAVAEQLFNDLQPAAISLQPKLGETLEAGRAAGALAGIVSGSGPTTAFLAASESAALDVARQLKAEGHQVVRVQAPVAGAKIIG